MFKETHIKDLKENFVKLIADEWMLITSGDESKFNSMTASWGSIGEMWGKDIATVVIRPQRYTKEFVDNNDYFSLCFFGDGAQKTVHSVCGSKSGRDVVKHELVNITPVFDNNTVYYEEARLVIICKKIYMQEIKSKSFIDFDYQKWYKDDDFHTAYVGKIVNVLIKNQ